MSSPRLAWLAAALLGAGCDGITTVSELPAVVTLKVGDELRLPERNLRFVLNEIAEDSRCPVNVDCVWEGRVVVRFEVFREPDPGSTDLLVNTQQPSFIAGLRIEITAIRPNRMAGVEIEQDAYRITLRVEQPPGPTRLSVARGRWARYLARAIQEAPHAVRSLPCCPRPVQPSSSPAARAARHGRVREFVQPCGARPAPGRDRHAALIPVRPG